MNNLLVVMTFAEWLKTNREKHKLTLVRLADKIGNICSDAYLSKLENAKYKSKKGNPMRPDKEIVIALADVFGANQESVLNLAGYATDSPLPPELIAVGFDGLDNDDIKQVADH